MHPLSLARLLIWARQKCAMWWKKTKQQKNVPLKISFWSQKSAIKQVHLKKKKLQMKSEQKKKLRLHFTSRTLFDNNI